MKECCETNLCWRSRCSLVHLQLCQIPSFWCALVLGKSAFQLLLKSALLSAHQSSLSIEINPTFRICREYLKSVVLREKVGPVPHHSFAELPGVQQLISYCHCVSEILHSWRITCMTSWVPAWRGHVGHPGWRRALPTCWGHSSSLGQWAPRCHHISAWPLQQLHALGCLPHPPARLSTSDLCLCSFACRK